MKKISVIVPNFNHGKYLYKRIKSILNQSFPIYELIIIDDASTDNSVKIIKNIINNINFSVKFIINKKNSGNVFKQWYKGISLAEGDYIWIAESDDCCKNNFLKEVIKPFDDERVVLSYCQSAVVDENDKIMHKNYLFYTEEISSMWKKDFIVDGLDLLFGAFYVKNVIPNASAVVFRKDKLKYVFDKNKEEIFKFNVAGDWYVYVLLSTLGKIAFLSDVLNFHRNHSNTCRNRFDHTHEVSLVRNKILEILYDQLKQYNKEVKYMSKNNKYMDLIFYLHKIIKSLNMINSLLNQEIKLKNIALDNLEFLRMAKSIAIFGLGKSGKMTYNFLSKFYPEKIRYFIDDNVKGNYEGILIVTTDEFLEKYQDEVDLVVYGRYQNLNPRLLYNLKTQNLKLDNII
ncbi:MAG: hypothetical protein PWR24_769 [Desulfonauticus sp.]|nr:hypothetical protein [Desulfonauticus sp.]